MHAFDTAAFPQLHFTTPYGFNGTDGKDTSVNPLWRTSLYQVITVNHWLYNATLADRKASYDATTAAIKPLRDLTPGGGAYHVSPSTCPSYYRMQILIPLFCELRSE